MDKAQMSGKRKFSDVPVRVRSWGAIIVILALALLHPLLTCLFVCFLSFVAVREFAAMLCHVKGWKYDCFLLILALIECYILYATSYNVFVIFSALYVFITVLIHYLAYKKSSILLNLQTALGVTLCVFSVGHLIYIRQFALPAELINGISLLLLLVILTELNDVFQYLTGKTFGRHKITPKISPNKTVEGFVGGMILTTLLSNLLGVFLLPDKGFAIYSLIGFFVGLLGFCGDIYMSSVKRIAKVKDTGNLIPGHGGLLDRIDSLLFITPVYYWLIYFLYIRP